MNFEELFGSLFLFKGIDLSKTDAEYSLSDSLKTAKYSDGDFIICDGLPVIYCGNAAIVSGENGHYTVLRRLYPKDTFGAASLFCKGSHKTRVISSGECTVAYIPIEKVEKLIKNEPICCENYIVFLSERIAFLNRKITAFTAGSTEARLAIYLLSLPQSDGYVSIPVSLSELSNMLGVGRASLYRSFDALTDSGLISKVGKSIMIHDRKSLENYY